jgi:hypothetical protein
MASSELRQTTARAARSVVEEHPELFHYTGAEGLHGIVSGQCLWATNIKFLNDAEEQRVFFRRRMRSILEEPLRTAWSHNPLFGGHPTVEQAIDQFMTAIEKAGTEFHHPYITSFCASAQPEVTENGLLSQWRGYGTDGGYAIVFDTAGLQVLLEQEAVNYHYQDAVVWGDIYYYSEARPEEMPPEVRLNEGILIDAIAGFIETRNQDALDPSYSAVSQLTCLIKHHGFHEEREVRIVAVPATAQMAMSRNNDDKCLAKTVHHFARRGTLVPYIKLFDRSREQSRPLPIKRVIVGPHPDSCKRKTAVELLLSTHKIGAEVVCSDIPYLGR